MTATAEQFHELFQYCVDFAGEMLTKSGAFYPFGAVITIDGKLGARGAWDGNEHPNPQELYTLQLDAFRAEAAQSGLVAVALAVDVNVPPQFESPHRDAIRVKLESPGYSRLLYVPYSVGKAGFLGRKRTVTLAEPFAVEVPPEVYREG